MKRGVVIFNAGNKMLARTAVMLNTLRRHWSGEIAYILDDASMSSEAVDLAREFGRRWEAQIIPAKFKTRKGKHRTYLNKCLMHEVSPFETSLLIDLDATIHGDVSPMLDAAEEEEFAVCQFADWKVKGRIVKRVRNWEGILPKATMKAAYAYPAAINTGVYGFRKNSKLMNDWWDYAVKGRESWIPDETCCQAMLASYPHRLMAPKYNTSCRYGIIPEAVIIHYHGDKHCRFDAAKVAPHFQYNSQVWYREFEQVRGLLPENFIENDRQLRRAVGAWDLVKGEPWVTKLEYPGV